MDIFALKAGDAIKVFLIGKGVESESLDAEKYPVTMQMMKFIAAGEKIFACGTCLKLRDAGPTDISPLAGLKDMHAIIRESERVITF